MDCLSLYGIEERGKGVLLTYFWSTDALNMVPASDEQRKNCALLDLKRLYPNVDIEKNLQESIRVLIGQLSGHWVLQTFYLGNSQTFFHISYSLKEIFTLLVSILAHDMGG